MEGASLRLTPGIAPRGRSGGACGGGDAHGRTPRRTPRRRSRRRVPRGARGWRPPPSAMASGRAQRALGEAGLGFAGFAGGLESVVEAGSARLEALNALDGTTPKKAQLERWAAQIAQFDWKNADLKDHLPI